MAVDTGSLFWTSPCLREFLCVQFPGMSFSPCEQEYSAAVVPECMEGSENHIPWHTQVSNSKFLPLILFNVNRFHKMEDNTAQRGLHYNFTLST